MQPLLSKVGLVLHMQHSSLCLQEILAMSFETTVMCSQADLQRTFKASFVQRTWKQAVTSVFLCQSHQLPLSLCHLIPQCLCQAGGCRKALLQGRCHGRIRPPSCLQMI